MKWILEHFQIVILIVGAFIYWLKERVEKKLAERQQREISNEAEVPDGDEYEPAMERPSLPHSLDAPSAQHGSASEGAAKSRKLRAAGNLSRIRAAKAAKATTTGGATATRDRLTTGTGKAADVTIPVKLRRRLRDRPEARRAIVMQEILSPPVGLR